MPRPGIFERSATSSRSTAVENSSALMPERMLSASFGPTPVTPSNVIKTFFST